jgi:hypothetical protein
MPFKIWYKMKRAYGILEFAVMGLIYHKRLIKLSKNMHVYRGCI